MSVIIGINGKYIPVLQKAIKVTSIFISIVDKKMSLPINQPLQDNVDGYILLIDFWCITLFLAHFGYMTAISFYE